MSKIVVIIINTLLLLNSCVDQNNDKVKKNDGFPFYLYRDSVRFINVIKKDTVYNIVKKDLINDILEKINNSKITYIKFGSLDHIRIYDLNKNILADISFNDNIFKMNGIVYKTKDNLIK